MKALVPAASPALLALAGERAGLHFLEFFAAGLRNRNTQQAYARTVADFFCWTEAAG